MSKKTAWVRLVGDCHGKLSELVHLASFTEYTLCVGDIGFDYRYLTRLVNPDNLRCLAGNHDNYTKTPCPKGPCPECQGKGYTYGEQSKHFLGDYGVWQPPEFCPIFYFRGAWSIDCKYRTPEISWWEDEEVPYQQMLQSFDFYKAARPEFVVTHTCPFSIVSSIPFDKIFGDVIHKPRTEEMLEQLYQEWQPTWWIFGHWHKNWSQVFEHPRTGKKTKFVCLGELASMDFPKNFAGNQIFDLQIADFRLK